MVFVDAGDGWFYFNDKERKQMNANNVPDGYEQINLPADTFARAKIMAAACMSFDSVPVPMSLLRHYLEFCRAAGADAEMVAECERLLDHFEQMKRDHDRVVLEIHASDIKAAIRSYRWN